METDILSLSSDSCPWLNMFQGVQDALANIASWLDGTDKALAQIMKPASLIKDRFNGDTGADKFPNIKDNGFLLASNSGL